MDAQAARGLLESEQARLLEVHRGLEAALQGERDGAGELSPLDQHQADMGSELFEREKEVSILHRVEVDLVEVSDALTRLDSGRYGTCQTCQLPISDERLEAVPATRFCADHEALWEGHHRTLSLPEDVYVDGGEPADLIAGREAARHLEFLPTDDEPDVDEMLGPEERALHVSSPGAPTEALDPAEVELAEMRDAGARADERIEAQRGEDAQRAEAEAGLVDEEGLGDATSTQQPPMWRRLTRPRNRR